jgi:hypothetical protein
MRHFAHTVQCRATKDSEEVSIIISIAMHQHFGSISLVLGADKPSL